MDDALDIGGIKAEIARLARELEARITAMNSQMRAAAADWPAVVYALPGHTSRQDVDVIPVQRVIGRNAREQALAMYAAIDYAPDQSPETVRRLLGVVCVPASCRPAIEAVNQAKKDLKAQVVSLPRGRWQRERSTMARAATLSLLQAYRQIRMVDHPYRLHFGWDGKGASGRRMSVAEARRLLDEPGYYGEISQARYDIERAALRELPADEIITQRKPIAPTPVANHWSQPKARPATFRVDMPVIAFCDAPNQAPEIADLESFDLAKRERKARSDRRVSDEPLVERLHLYRYEAGYRQTEA